jgi:hypothetical protein
MPSAGKPQSQAEPSLEDNLRILNEGNRDRQIDRLNKRYGMPAPAQGVQVQQAH